MNIHNVFGDHCAIITIMKLVNRYIIVVLQILEATDSVSFNEATEELIDLIELAGCSKLLMLSQQMELVNALTQFILFDRTVDAYDQ